MADGLETIVQRMVDAGEPEENIATVIQHFKAQAPSVARPTLDPSLSRLWGKPVVPPPQSDAPVEPNLPTQLVHGMASLAEPHDVADMAGLLIPGGGGAAVSRLVSPIVKGAAKYGGAAVELGTSLLPAKARGALRMLSELNPTSWNSPLTVAGREGRAVAAAQRFNAQPLAQQMEQFPAVPAPTPARTAMPPYHPQTPFHEQPLYRQMDRLPDVPAPATTRSAEPPMVAPPDPVVPTASHAPSPVPQSGGLSAADRASLVKQGFAPQTIAKIEAQIAPAASHTPVSAPPVAPVASHPLTAPRVDVGAEAVAKAEGLTKQGVRDVTGPIYGEQPGEAAPVFPESAYQRMAGKMRPMHPSPGDPAGDAAAWASRLDYANQARDPKSLSQLISMMRAWRDVHMAIPAAVGGGLTVRELVRKRLQAGSQ